MATHKQLHGQLRVRLRESYVWCGGLGIGIACILSGVTLYDHLVRGGAIRSLLFVLVVCGLWVLLSCCLITARLWSYVELNDREVLQRGILKSRRIPWTELKSVRWNWPTTTIVLLSATEKISLDPVRGFERGSAIPFIELLHERTKHVENIGWSEYVHQVALPLRKRSSATREEINDETHVWSTRKRIDMFMGSVTGLFFLIGIAMAIGLQQWRFLTAAFPMVLLWGILRFSTPKNGEPQPRIRSSVNSKYVTWMVYWGLANAVGIGVANALGVVDPAIAVWTIIALVVLTDLPRFQCRS